MIEKIVAAALLATGFLAAGFTAGQRWENAETVEARSAAKEWRTNSKQWQANAGVWRQGYEDSEALRRAERTISEGAVRGEQEWCAIRVAAERKAQAAMKGLFAKPTPAQCGVEPLFSAAELRPVLRPKVK